MQASQCSFCGHGLVILYEMNINACLFHISFVVGFHEITTLVTMNGRFYDTKAFDAAYVFLNFDLSHFLYLLLQLFSIFLS